MKAILWCISLCIAGVSPALALEGTTDGTSTGGKGDACPAPVVTTRVIRVSAKSTKTSSSSGYQHGATPSSATISSVYTSYSSSLYASAGSLSFNHSFYPKSSSESTLGYNSSSYSAPTSLNGTYTSPSYQHSRSSSYVFISSSSARTQLSGSSISREHSSGYSSRYTRSGYAPSHPTTGLAYASSTHSAYPSVSSSSNSYNGPSSISSSTTYTQTFGSVPPYNGPSSTSFSTAYTQRSGSGPSSSYSLVGYPSGGYNHTIYTSNSTFSYSHTSTNIVSSSLTSSSAACKTPSVLPSQKPCVPCYGQTGTPDNWCGAGLQTDYYNFVPETCVIREYTLEITNTTIAPDGIERTALLVNGQMPGPPIEANWGDTVIVHVTNKLQNNGTSIHFHGIRQNYTNENDGVPSITQCPIPPGESMTYTWVASTYGTSWYHSHLGIQTWEGVFGPIIIQGPHSGDYDVDAGAIMLQDWSHQTVDSMFDMAQDASVASGGPRTMDTGLINGMNAWGVEGASNYTGKRFQLAFEPGNTYLLRLVNVAIQSTFNFYIDGHKMTVISMDFTPIVPYETDVLSINIGQRYNVLVTADAAPGAYWMRSDNQPCAAMIQGNNVKGIISYPGYASTIPTSTAYNYTAGCVDEPLASQVPILQKDASAPGSNSETLTEDVTLGIAGSVYRWYLSGTTFVADWNDPTLLHLLENNNSLPTESGSLIIDLPNPGEWVYVIVESPSGPPLPHPIHLHGHDFYVLGSGAGSFSGDIGGLKFSNPPRRDTTLMPTNGWTVIAFETDNPGVWLMHCHVGWHVSMGFALQFVEMRDQIAGTVEDSCKMKDICKSWKEYTLAGGINMTDSGV